MLQDLLLLERARQLRRTMTPAEKILWPELRGRRFAGFKFRRQQVIAPYIVDFFAFELELAIEVDGETHLDRDKKDAHRQRQLELQGIKVIRFWNT